MSLLLSRIKSYFSLRDQTNFLQESNAELRETIETLMKSIEEQRKSHDNYLRSATILSDASYGNFYSEQVSQILAERKGYIRQSWEEDTSFSERTDGRNYDDTDDFVKLTKLFENLLRSKDRVFTRIVEIGCGDAKYLEYLGGRTTRGREIEWIATDVEGPRLERARIDVSGVRVEEADILQCLSQYNTPGTLFLSANVFGNIVPDEIFEFFKAMTIPNTGLVFPVGL